MRLTLALLRVRGTTSGGERPLRWRGGDRALACDLRSLLVQRLRDAAHSPDARAEVSLVYVYILKM